MVPGEFECWGHFIEPWGLKAYVTWMTIAVFILPALIITVCQVICRISSIQSVFVSKEHQYSLSWLFWLTIYFPLHCASSVTRLFITSISARLMQHIPLMACVHVQNVPGAINYFPSQNTLPDMRLSDQSSLSAVLFSSLQQC